MDLKRPEIRWGLLRFMKRSFRKFDTGLHVRGTVRQMVAKLNSKALSYSWMRYSISRSGVMLIQGGIQSSTTSFLTSHCWGATSKQTTSELNNSYLLTVQIHEISAAWMPTTPGELPGTAAHCAGASTAQAPRRNSSRPEPGGLRPTILSDILNTLSRVVEADYVPGHPQPQMSSWRPSQHQPD